VILKVLLFMLMVLSLVLPAGAESPDRSTEVLTLDQL
jgi:hypothetical protein